MTIQRYTPKKLPARQTARASRPKNAATLVLTRMLKGKTHVLMGQRHSRHKFMPDLYVFPGGGVSIADHRIAPLKPLRSNVHEKLLKQSRFKNPQALALASIRETFEETGVLVGEQTARKRTSRSAEWKDYFSAGLEPRLDSLEFIARAITPPSRDRRFDARFFLGGADLIQGDPDDFSGASGELENITWIDLQQALELETADITEAILRHLNDRSQNRRHDPNPIFVRYKRGLMDPERL